MGFNQPGLVRTLPRCNWDVVTPTRLADTLLPGPTLSTRALCVCKPRNRVFKPTGAISTSCPTEREPSINVPVTTVPAPAIVKTRSISKRGRPRSFLGSARARSSSITATSSFKPSSFTAETATMGAPDRVVSPISSSISILTRLSNSSSTRSFLVMTTIPFCTLSRSRIARCSLVWGITPSLAAIMSMARSIPPTPASMFFTKRSCPGTSTIPTSRPLGSLSQAKPRSMVMPRSFSSRRRSGSIPVRAFTKTDLPWSMCPAVPSTNIAATYCRFTLSRVMSRAKSLSVLRTISSSSGSTERGSRSKTSSFIRPMTGISRLRSFRFNL